MKEYNIVPRRCGLIKARFDSKVTLCMIDFGCTPFSYRSIRVDLTDRDKEGEERESNPQKDVQIQAHKYLKINKIVRAIYHLYESYYE